ncbi:phage shock protein operon transcriptional activator [Halioxenophilus aromaticivorans]
MAEKNANRNAIGESRLYLNALDHASQLAHLDRPVLILGERGSGKELLAHRLHFLSPRWDEPFIKLNCAALTESLVESALFGHEAGAFTGATKAQTGYFERVAAGTLFLDEVATLSLRTQEKLLRVLEYGEFERLGGQKTLVTQARVVAATHGDLATMAAAGDFRHDLLDRLAFDVVHMPPLRLRDSDALLLAEHFAVAFIGGLGWDYFPGFAERAQQQILQHSWPGNVRELKNVVERSLFRSGAQADPIAQLVIDPFTPPWAASPWTEHQDQDSPATESITAQHSQTSRSPTKQPPEQQTSSEPLDFKQARAHWERTQLQQALAACDHHQGRTAAHLGLSYDQLRALLRKLKISAK